MKQSKWMGVSCERGFTLVEFVVAIAIIGIISIPVVASIIQVFVVSSESSSHMTAVKAVENAIHWITDDAQMAQQVDVTGPAGFPLTLSWVEWSGDFDCATYNLVDGQLQRSYTLNHGPPEINVIAANIDSSRTSCALVGRLVEFTVTATVDGFRPASETRTITIQRRSGP
jgi:prepilin-type N-terminal cleavage/methylation domain-containing protein